MSGGAGFRLFALAVFTALVAGVGACSDRLDSRGSCPLLCPQEGVPLRDTLIDVVSDTTVLGFPPFGYENYMLLTSRGDTLETRVIVRYDTLFTTYHTSAGDSEVTTLDSAFLRLGLLIDTLRRNPAPVTIEAYDVDTLEGFDTSATVLASLFRKDRFLASRSFAPESLLDSVFIRLPTDSVLGHMLAHTRMRIGLKVVSTKSASVLIESHDAGTGPRLISYASKDTTVPPVANNVFSLTPATPLFLANALGDYVVTVKGGSPPASSLISVGGLPGRRAIINLNIPSYIVDSSSIVRATLLLHQKPNRTIDPKDTVPLSPGAFLINSVVTDPETILGFLSPPGAFGLLEHGLVPSDSGVQGIEIGPLVRTWGLSKPDVNRRSVALRSSEEAEKPGQLDFFSTRAAPALRPKLRITYVPRTNFGVP